MTDTSAALHPGVWGYALAAAGYVLLAVLLLTSWRGRLQGGLLLALSLVSALWAGSLAYALAYALPLSIQYAALELLRSGVALLFLYKILPLGKGLDSSNVSGLRWMAYAVAAVWVCVLALHGYTWFYEQSVAATSNAGPSSICVWAWAGCSRTTFISIPMRCCSTPWIANSGTCAALFISW